MANYQELLSRAVGALPENNGASRREVYEKARKALVTQLRSISPPLPAREITQHRLELEDCIRQVEHEATEALLGGLKDLDEETIPLVDEAPIPAPAPVEPAEVAPGPLANAQSETVNAQVGISANIPSSAPEAARTQGDGGLDDGELDDGELALAEKPLEVESSAPVTIEAGQVAETVEPPQRESSQAKPVPGSEITSIDAIIARAEAAREKTAKETAQRDAEDAAKRDARDAAEAKKTAERDAAQTEENEAEARDELAAKQAREAEAADKIEVRAAQDRAAQNLAGEQSTTHQDDAGDDANAALEDALKSAAQGNASLASDAAVGAAMSRVREVEVEAPGSAAHKPANGVDAAARTVPVIASVDAPKGDDAQKAVDRAIQVLDREARGEPASEDDLSLEDAFDANRPPTSGEAGFGAEGDEEKGGNALTVFLLLAVVLLGAVGGGGYWAWREEFVDLDALFSSSQTPPVTDIAVPLQAAVETSNSGTPIRDVTADAQAPGPGNTATDVGTEVPSDEIATVPADDKSADRLPTDNGTPIDPNITEPQNSDTKVEDRLTTDAQPEISVPGQNSENGDAALTTGRAQSLLLEASSDGTSGAVPFSGTVSWSRGVDELGQPTLIATAKIPARNLGVRLLIRRNGDASLPASHLMEIDFDVSETFSGGAVAGLPGILLKNEELVQGSALVGASARVVGNSFLFALSAADQDVRNNISLLENNKWMDLALVYATGKRAIITLEKDAAAQAMFTDVLGAWRAADAEAAAASAAETTPAAHTGG